MYIKLTKLQAWTLREALQRYQNRMRELEQLGWHQSVLKTQEEIENVERILEELDQQQFGTIPQRPTGGVPSWLRFWWWLRRFE